MKKMFTLINSMKALGLVLVLLLPHLVAGQTTNYVSWDFTTALASGSYDATQANMDAVRTTVLSSPTFTGLTLTGATSANNSTTLHRSTGWPNNTASVTASATSYVQFTVTLANGQTFPNSTLTLDLSVGTSSATTAPNRLQPIYGYGASPTYAVIGSAATLATAQTALSTITIPAPGNITTTKLTIRLAAFATGTSTQTGNLRLYTVALKGSTPLTGTPTIALQSPSQVAAANVSQGASNQPISNFQADVTTSTATLNSVAFTTGGSYITSDITGFKLYYNSTANTFGSAVQIGTTQASVASAGTVTFSGLTTSINSGSTGYFWITASVSASGTISNTFNAAATPTLTFTSGTPTGSITAGGTQTIVDCTPVNVTSTAASVGNTNSILTWTNPACYDEILIVAAPAANTGTPTGDGTVYTANLIYGSGTGLGNGFVVYKGATSSQTVTALTNGTPYSYKFFTRKGTTWSAGIEVSATPVLVTAATDYFRSKVTGDWATAGNWESSVDNAAWITATLVPSSTANTISIESGHVMAVSLAITADQIVIKNGGTLTNTTGLTINNGTGDDIVVQNGGTLIYTTLPTNTGTTTRVNSGGVVSVRGSGMTANAAGVNATTHVYDDGAILEWNLATGNPSSSGVTFFPNVDANTAPIFRFATVTNGVGSPFGGANPTVINGVINVATGITITLSGTNTKTFRNGINGAGNLDQGSAGQIVINGTNAILTGSGTLTIGTNGLSITNANTITADKLIAGTGALTKAGAGLLELQATNTYTGLTTVSAGTLKLNKTGGTTIPATNNVTVTGGTFQVSTNQTLNNLIVNGGTVTVDDGATLTINGTLTLTSGNITLGTTGTGNVVVGVSATISGGSSTSYIVTNGTGTLKALNFAGEKTFPIGTAANYAPVKIDNSPASSRDFSAKVGTTISGTPADPAKVIPLQWDITPSVGDGSPNNAALTLSWPTALNIAPFNAAAAVEIAHFGSTWDAFKLATIGTNGALTTASASGFTTFSPFVVANQTALAVDFLKIAVKANDTKNIVSWSTASEKNNAGFNIERSANGLNFQSIGTVKGNGTTNATNNYTFEDATPAVGMNYYRLRQLDVNGAETVSKVVSIINGGKKGELKVYPTLASDRLNLIGATENTDFSVVNLLGQTVLSGRLTNATDINISALAKGTYILRVAGDVVKFAKN
jgi:Passenger-associated-transport-repeat